MLTWSIEQLVKELKAHPFTLIIIMALVGFTWFASSTHAKATDIQEIAREVSNNSTKIDRLLKLQLAEAIRTISLQVCEHEDDQQRRDLIRTRDRLQEDYRLVNDGREYKVEACYD